MSAHFLITGGTGFIGSSLLPRIIRDYPDAAITLLVREPDGPRTRALAERLGREARAPAAPERLKFLRGDVSLDQCGLSPENVLSLARSVTHIIHGAAAIRFDQPIADARRVNCDGTRRMLDLAARCVNRGDFQRFIYIGTSSVSGRRAGTIREDELDTGQAFFNTYEQSKCEAEQIVRQHFGRIPCTVFRPSIVIGDSTNGWTSSFNVIYIPLRLLSLGLLRWLPGSPETTLDLVPVDWVNDALLHITAQEGSAGGVYHLTAGPEKAARLGDVVRDAVRYFEHRLPLAAPRDISFMTPDEFAARRAAARGRETAILSQLDTLLPYVGVDRRFDTSHADAMLNGSGIRFPRFEEYSERIYAYCVESRWGKGG